MRDREYRCSECLQLQDKEMESPYVCEGCLEEHQVDFTMEKDNSIKNNGSSSMLNTLFVKDFNRTDLNGNSLFSLTEKIMNFTVIEGYNETRD